MRKKAGMSLSEVLMCLALTSFMMLMIVRQYTSFKYQMLQTVQRLQERTAHLSGLMLLRQSIQSAGFTPCGSIRQLIHPTDRLFLPIDIGKGDQLLIHHMIDPIRTIRWIHSPTAVELSQALPSTAQRVLIADCYHAEAHVIAHATGKTITFQTPLQYTYHPPIYIAEWASERFWVQKDAFQRATLFYHFHHTERLMPWRKALSVRLEGKKVHVERVDHAIGALIVRMRMG